MLEFNAFAFYRASVILQALRGMAFDDGSGNRALDSSTKRMAPEQANDLLGPLTTIGARLALKSVQRLIEVLDNNTYRITNLAFIGCIDDIDSRIRDELSFVNLLAIEQEKQRYYERREPLFGHNFVAKFPSEGAFELDEASKCLALGRPTACVFHLMRLLEIGIRSLARCL